jgi:hypothetical protein
MNRMWATLFSIQARRFPAAHPGELAQDAETRIALGDLLNASRAWLSPPADHRPDLSVADEFARRVRAAPTREKLISALVHHHELRAGGRPWFRLDEKGLVRPATALRDQDGALYGYRLFALARLAVQCGVISRIPTPLRYEEEPDV